MHFRKIVFVCLVLSCIFLLSCQKLQQAPPSTLKIEKMKSLDAIPAEFGKLVGVTISPVAPDLAQLWFEKPDKTIMVVKVEWMHGYISDQVLVIPRR